jgi:hypothetical protein
VNARLLLDRRAFAAGLAGLGIAAISTRTALAVDETQGENELLQALHDGDKATLAKRLDANFIWVDPDGKVRGKDETLRDLPKPVLPVHMGFVNVKPYGEVVAFMVEHEGNHVLRLWVRHPTGAQLLIQHEVKVNPQPPARTGGDVKDCENPCKTLPYKPRNADEQAVIDAWQALERAVTAHDAEAWSPHMASEFALVSTNGVQTKAGRIATLNRQKAAGAPTVPPPLVSANMFGFDGTIVMTCLHQPHTGKQIRVTRLWTKRDGRWQMAKSYQTVVQDSVAKTQ